MIIHEPQILTSGDMVTTWAAIEYDCQKPRLPAYLWYRFPIEYAQYISLQSDAFLLPMMMLAINLREDIQVRGVISPMLAYNLEEYQRVLSVWMPDYIQPVKIDYARLAPSKDEPGAVGVSYSGGVDSTFTLWANRPETQSIPGYRITHALYIKGMDLIHEWDEIYKTRRSQFSANLAMIGVTLISAETNANRAIIGRFPPLHFYSTPLLGCVYALGGLFRRFYVASTWHHSQFIHQPSAANPLAERLFSSENMEVIQHGAETLRVEKVRAIADWNFAHQNLKVCFKMHEKKIFNCCRCEKCTRTLLPIYVLGKSDKFITFEKPFKKDRDLLRWARVYDPSRGFVPETRRFVQQHRRDLLPLFYLALVLGNLRLWAVRSVPRFLKRFLQRWGYYQPMWKDDRQFEMPEVIEEIEAFDRGASRAV